MMRRRELMGMQGVLKTVSGPIVTVNDALARNAKSLVVNFAPVQASGTPSPDNVLPISGWTGVTGYRTGVNLLDQSTYITSTSTSWQTFNLQLLPNTTYTLSSDVSENRFRILTTNTDLSGNGYPKLNNPITFTTNTTALVTLGYYSSSSGTKAPDYHYQLELGTTPTPYTPYTGTTYPVDWTDVAGTVYGGYMDLVSGVMTVDRGGYVGKWQDGTNEQAVGETLKNRRFSLEYTPLTGTANNICNIAKYSSGGGEVVRFNVTVNKYAFVTLPNDTSETQDIQIVSKLATPITYQLTPQTTAMLKGTNNVWSNANGNVELTYYAQ